MHLESRFWAVAEVGKQLSKLAPVSNHAASAIEVRCFTKDGKQIGLPHAKAEPNLADISLGKFLQYCADGKTYLALGLNKCEAIELVVL